MEKQNIKFLSVRVDKEIHYKLTYIAEFYERDLSRLCTIMYKRKIEAFEKKHGKINIPTDL